MYQCGAVTNILCEGILLQDQVPESEHSSILRSHHSDINVCMLYVCIICMYVCMYVCMCVYNQSS